MIRSIYEALNALAVISFGFIFAVVLCIVGNWP